MIFFLSQEFKKILSKSKVCVTQKLKLGLSVGQERIISINIEQEIIRKGYVTKELQLCF